MHSEFQFIYTLRVRRQEMLSAGPSPEEKKCLEDHVCYLDHLTKTGQVLLAGRTQTTDASTFGIVIIDTTSEASANEIMGNDPVVLGGLMSGELFPFEIAVISPNILGGGDA